MSTAPGSQGLPGASVKATLQTGLKGRAMLKSITRNSSLSCEPHLEGTVALGAG